jgi:hypothetical protein
LWLFNGYFLVFLTWLVALFVKIKINGLVYGFDFGLYHPDGAFYTFKSLTLLGISQSQSANLVAVWYENHSLKLRDLSPESLYFDVNPIWQLYDTRFLYPFLSVPFVKVFGIPGMLVVPGISLLILLISIYQIGRILDRSVEGLFLAILVSFSPVTIRWMFINTTDSLFVALTSLAVLLILRINSKYSYYALLVVITLTSFTRFSYLLWIAVSFIIFMNINRFFGLIIFIVSSLGFIPSVFTNIDLALQPALNNESIMFKILHLPGSFFRIIMYEITQLFVLDKILFIILVLGTIISIMSLNKVSSRLYLATLCSLLIVGAINGTVGVNFRYQLPVIPFLAYAILDNVENIIVFSERLKRILYKPFGQG